MWTINKPYYSEKNMILMLKEANTEKLVEFLLMEIRDKKDGKM